GDGHPQHPVGDHLPAHRSVHALQRLLDACPLRERPTGALGGGPCRRGEHLAGVPPHPAAVGEARAVGACDPAVPVDLEPVPAARRARREPARSHGGRCADLLPRAVLLEYPVAERGRAHHHHARHRGLPDLPTAVHPRAAPGRGEGMSPVAIEGTVAPGFEPVADAFRAAFEVADTGAALAVRRRGGVVVDLWGGVADPVRGTPWTRDTHTTVFSCTKGLMSILAA